MDPTQKLKPTAFLSESEWFLYYSVIPRKLMFFEGNKEKFDQYCDQIRNALSYLEIVGLRNSKNVPISFNQTMELLKLPLYYQDPYLKVEDMNKLMSFTVVRVVNFICDCGQNAKLGRSIAKILEQLDMKEHGLITEVRHAATHKIFPSLEVTQASAQSLYGYLIEHYWNTQFKALAQVLRDSYGKVYRFLDSLLKEDPRLFSTNIRSWEDVEQLLFTKKSNKQGKTTKQLMADADKSTNDKDKLKKKRALKVWEVLNKLIAQLKRIDVRILYVSSGKFSQDLASLTSLINQNARPLFQRYSFLQYRVKRIVSLIELCPEYGQVIETLKSKVPTILKDLDEKHKMTKKQLRDYKFMRHSVQEYDKEEDVPILKDNLDLQEQILDEWIPEQQANNLINELF